MAAGAASPKQIVASVAAYSLCSGTLVLWNKLILHFLPYPSLIICLEFFATLLFIYIANAVGYLPVDPVRWKFVVPYLYYIVTFSLVIYCNMKALVLANVDTIIVFHALSPAAVALLDAKYLGRLYPNARSWFGLALIVAGAAGYACYDEAFRALGISAYMWPTLYLIFLSVETVYGKKILKSVDLKTRSGPVLYSNLLGLFAMLLFASTDGEFATFFRDRYESRHPLTSLAIVCLVLGCVSGVGIGFTSWWCRDLVSATSFTLIGVLNKCLTVLLNVVVWDKHAPPAGIACLLLCLVGGFVYRQAPMRDLKIAATRRLVAQESDDVWEADDEETTSGSSELGKKLSTPRKS